MKILSIETSCDETSIALVKASGGLAAPKFKIIKNLVASQIETHRPWGGVVPNLAKREHLINLPIIFLKIMGRNFQFLSLRSPYGRSTEDRDISRKKTISNFQINPKSKIPNPKAQTLYSSAPSDYTPVAIPQWLYPNLIAVTVGPGLEPCLWTGINFAKQIQKQYFPKAEIIGVNHLHGHLYSFLLTLKTKSYQPSSRAQAEGLKTNELFPAIALIVSGGHTILLLMKSLTEYKKLGETRDDAAGEAFDKVARMLNLPYPGGPEIEKLAKYGNPNSINFPRPMQNSKNYDFSFSGLKTAVLYFLKKQPLKVYPPTKIFSGGARSLPHTIPQGLVRGYKPSSRAQAEGLKANIASSFQQAAIDVLVLKTIRAAKEFQAKSVILSGGVAANKALRKTFIYKLKVYPPTKIFSGGAINYKPKLVSAPIKYHTDNAAMIAAAGYITKLKNKKQPLKANGNLGVG